MRSPEKTFLNNQKIKMSFFLIILTQKSINDSYYVAKIDIITTKKKKFHL